jgi:hypothetical protein
MIIIALLNRNIVMMRDVAGGIGCVLAWSDVSASEKTRLFPRLVLLLVRFGFADVLCESVISLAGTRGPRKVSIGIPVSSLLRIITT